MSTEENHVPYRPGMTLMPGQSTTVSVNIPIPAEVGKALGSGQGCFVEVPPPSKAPTQDIAETLGLIDGLRAERSRDQWRCAECHQMQQGGAWQIWVPDGVRRRDPTASITEACRLNAYNGHHSAWCLECAPKTTKSLPWWKRIFSI